MNDDVATVDLTVSKEQPAESTAQILKAPQEQATAATQEAEPAVQVGTVEAATAHFAANPQHPLGAVLASGARRICRTLEEAKEFFGVR